MASTTSDRLPAFRPTYPSRAEAEQRLDQLLSLLQQPQAAPAVEARHEPRALAASAAGVAMALAAAAIPPLLIGWSVSASWSVALPLLALAFPGALRAGTPVAVVAVALLGAASGFALCFAGLAWPEIAAMAAVAAIGIGMVLVAAAPAVATLGRRQLEGADLAAASLASRLAGLTIFAQGLGLAG